MGMESEYIVLYNVKKKHDASLLEIENNIFTKVKSVMSRSSGTKDAEMVVFSWRLNVMVEFFSFQSAAACEKYYN